MTYYIRKPDDVSVRVFGTTKDGIELRLSRSFL